MTHSCHFIDHQWTSSKGQPFASVNPSTQMIEWQGNAAGQEEVQAAVSAAHAALYPWARLPLEKRIEYLHTFAAIVKERSEVLTRYISNETGKPLWEAKTEAQAVAAKIELSIRAYQERTPTRIMSDAAGQSGIYYKAHGVMAVLGPFNFPAHLSNGHIVPALLAGNTIVYKPSELAPKVAELITQFWEASQLPAGVFNLIQGKKETAELLLKENIQGVLFTGSYPTGLAISQQMSRRPEVILALEMGGNNPLIIEEVSNRTAAVYHTILSSFITAGQRCACVKRIFIPHNTFGNIFLEELIQAARNIRIGFPDQNPAPFYGPVIHLEQAHKHLKAQERLQQLGGAALLTMRLVEKDKPLLTPGIIDMTSVKNAPDEEIFAPFIQIYRYQNFEEALLKANQTQYGLAAGLLSDNPAHYQQFLETIRAGVIYWNRATTGASSLLPFGGIGHSGNHRPAAYFAADFCAYPMSSQTQTQLGLPEQLLPGIIL